MPTSHEASSPASVASQHVPGVDEHRRAQSLSGLEHFDDRGIIEVLAVHVGSMPIPDRPRSPVSLSSSLMASFGSWSGTVQARRSGRPLTDQVRDVVVEDGRGSRACPGSDAVHHRNRGQHHVDLVLVAVELPPDWQFAWIWNSTPSIIIRAQQGLWWSSGPTRRIRSGP